MIGLIEMKTYDILYEKNDNFWGCEESNAAQELVKNLGVNDGVIYNILEIGCGEGRDSIYFAQQGYNVTAVDSSKEGIKVLNSISRNKGFKINTIVSNIENYTLNQEFDAIFSIGTLHYVKATERIKLFERMKTKTKNNGINVISIFCKKPFVKEMRTKEEADNLFESGELMYYYRDWEIISIEEKIKDCTSNNMPHRHVKNTIIARKIM